MSESENTQEQANQDLTGVKILMVEDDALLSELTLMRLSESGCTAYAAADGASALKMAKEHKPDVIILDMMLPGLSGEEVLRKLKDDHDLAQIPVIVFSNKADQEGIKYCLEVGACEYLVKSQANLKDLVASVLRAIGRVSE